MAETIVRVPLGERAYDIVIGDNLLEGAGARLKAMFPGRKFAIITDTQVAAAQLNRLTASLHDHQLTFDVLLVDPGEATKSVKWLEIAVNGLLERRYERGDTVLALGG